MYKEKTGRKTIKETKKLLGVMKAKKVLLHMIRQCLQHGLRLTAVHRLSEYEQGKPFLWFPEEEANTRREVCKGPLKNN